MESRRPRVLRHGFSGFAGWAVGGVVGSLAGQHFSFMGSLVSPPMLEASARQVAAVLRKDGVDTVFLTPV